MARAEPAAGPVATLGAELVVVGAGPAGMAAAVAAAQVGVDTVLVDAQQQPGGRYFRHGPPAAGVSRSLRRLRSAQQAALQQLADSPVRVVRGALVWGAFPAGDRRGWELALHGCQALGRLAASSLILAPGAFDRPIAFPGWTLPGVMTAGGVQAFLKGQRMPPGRRFLLSGTGPLQIAVAAALVASGARVVAVLEGARLGWRTLHAAAALWGQWSRLVEGWDTLRTLRRAGVPIRTGMAVVEARGAGQVEEATICRLDDDWRPRPHTAETVAVDTLALGYGLLPRTELSRLLGCAHEFRPKQGGFVPCRDARMRTSLPGVFAAGDGAGIGGAAMAQIEGRIAGVAAAHYLGKLSEAAVGDVIRREQRALSGQRRFAATLSRHFTPGPGTVALADDDTIICRCEEVTLGEIRRAVAEGASDANAVKGLTRAGMGNCQGRVCGELVARIIAAERGGANDPAALRAAGCFTVRPPLEPLPLSVLARPSEPSTVH